MSGPPDPKVFGESDLKKRYLIISLVTAALVVVSAAGYLVPEKQHKLPVRILFDNSGGKVIFTHLAHHRDYQIPCEDCHHEGGEHVAHSPLPCGSCHPVAFNQDYVRDHVNSFPDKSFCVKCHHAEFGSLNFDHTRHEEYADGDCQMCHHGPDIESEPQRCENCHTLAGTKDMLSVRDASHERCVQCHEDMFDAKMSGCAPCHKMKDMRDYTGPYTPCAQCHDTKGKKLILTRTNAFHDQCMDCHKKRKKGPYGDGDCNKCHIK